MGRVVFVLLVAALITGAARSAGPDPVETRTQALLELSAAIEDEERALAMLKRDPPAYLAAEARLDRAADRLNEVMNYLSGIEGARVAEEHVRLAIDRDQLAAGTTDTKRAIRLVTEALSSKRAALRRVRALPAAPPPASPQCSDGKDNDGDGVTDWTDEPGCTSARDVRESSPLSCVIDSKIASSRLVLSGSCSGAFSELEVTLLDGVQLSGRYDIAHAPSCSPPSRAGFRCSTKNAAQNPGHRVDLRLTTTSTDRRQRVALRFFNKRKRPVLRVVVPPR